MGASRIRPLAVVMHTVVSLAVVSLAGCSSSSSTAPPDTVTSRAEVEAFVDEAVEFAKKNGKDAAIEQFDAPDGQFQRGELYIYAYDFNGNVLAHGGNPALVGQNLMGLTDSTGAKVVAQIAELARAGSGWLQFRWPNPDHANADEVKFGYVRKVADDWFVGSGTYASTE